MIGIANINVSTLARESLTITWNVQETTENLDNYILAILRSNSESGPYLKVSKDVPASSTYQFVDSTVNLYSKHREYFYRIKVTNTATNESLEFGSVPPEVVMAGGNPRGAFLEAPPDLEALEAIRRNDLLLRNYIGRRVLFLKRRDTGTRCTSCWDVLKRRRTKSTCVTCFNTGVIGGYYYAQETFAAKAPENIVTALSQLFELQPNDLVFTISSFPRVVPRDLVIADDKRYRVINVRRAEKLYALTHQTVQVRELSKDQIEYKINVTSWGKTTQTASPSKQFINATDIDSYNRAVQRLGFDE